MESNKPYGRNEKNAKEEGELKYNNWEEGMDWSGQEKDWQGRRFSTETMKEGEKGL